MWLGELIAGDLPRPIVLNELRPGVVIQKGGLVTPQALAANKWSIDLYRTEKVEPLSAATDGFVQTVNNMKAGRTR